MSVQTFTGFEVQSVSEFSANGGTYSWVAALTGAGGSSAFRTNPTTTGTGYGEIQGIDTDGMFTSLALSDAYASFYFKADTLPSANHEIIFAFMSPGAAYKLRVAIDSSGNLLVIDKDGTTVATGSTALSTGTVYKIDVRGGNGTSANYEVRIDDSSEVSGTCNQQGNAVAAVRFGKAQNLNGETVDFTFDSLVIDSAAYVADGYEIGVGVPNADGSTQVWGAGTGAGDYTQIDEIPDVISDYLEPTGSAGDVALFDVENAATIGVSGTIHGVMLFARLRAPSGTQATALRIRSGSTNSDSADHDTTSTAVTRRMLATVDPDTSSAWTVSGIDGVEVGVVENNATATTRLAHASLHILYTPASGGTTVTPGVADATMSGVDPTVSAGAVSLSPPVADSTMAGNDPTVTLGGVTLSPTVAAAILTALDATPLPGGVALTPPVAEALLAALDPVIVVGAAILTPGTASALLAALDATVTAGGVSVTPPVAEALLYALDPSITVGTSVSASVAAAVLGAIDPSVQPGGVTLPLADSAPALLEALGGTVVAGGANVSAQVAAALLQANDAAGLSATVTVSPAVASALLQALDAAVTPGSVSVAPDVAAAILYALDPTLIGGVQFTLAILSGDVRIVRSMSGDLAIVRTLSHDVAIVTRMEGDVEV